MAYTVYAPGHIPLRLEKPCHWCLRKPQGPNKDYPKWNQCCSVECKDKWLRVRRIMRQPGERRCTFCEGRLMNRNPNANMGEYCGSRCKKAASEFRFGLETPQNIFHDGRWYHDANTLYHTRKFLPAHPKIADEISRCENLRAAMKVIWAYEKAGYARSDWEEVEDETLRDVVRLKFGKSHQLRMALKAIKERFIVADMPHDPWLGNGSGGRGENKLGKALTKYRDMLQEDILTSQ